MNKKEIANLKLEGYLNQSDKEYFSVRILSKAGNMTAQQLKDISYIADKYGKGYVGFTTRMGVEVPWIKAENIDNVKQELDKFGLKTGGTGKKVRPLVSCKGTVCVHGIVDTQKFCGKLHDKFFAKELPAKFKIGIVGCPNNCAKANLNDLGFMGQMMPKLNKDTCKVCGLCASNCKTGALTKIEKEMNIDYSKCLSCGECVRVCPTKSMTADKKGVAVFLGGRFGRNYRLGNRVDGIFSEEKIETITEKVLSYYNKVGKPGERFSDTINRIGWDTVQSEIFCEK